MRVLIYSIFSENIPQIYDEIYVLKNEKYVAILVGKLPLLKNKKLKKILELKKSLKLKLVEITQNQFLNYIKNEKYIKIKSIEFNKTVEDEEIEKINELIKKEKKLEAVKKIAEDNNYFYIEAIKIELLNERIQIIINKNLELDVEDNSYDRYSEEKLFEILEKKKVISTLVEQEDIL